MISLSPTTNESMEDATKKKCLNASSPSKRRQCSIAHSISFSFHSGLKKEKKRFKNSLSGRELSAIRNSTLLQVLKYINSPKASSCFKGKDRKSTRLNSSHAN